jgi:hypothetical protein
LATQKDFAYKVILAARRPALATTSCTGRRYNSFCEAGRAAAAPFKIRLEATLRPIVSRLPALLLFR